MSTIPYGRQHISDEDIEAVVKVLRSDYLTQGPAVPEFERKVADYCKVKHAIAVSSATSALHIACLALGVQAGDRVWTSAITFAASANCARYCGADVDFVEIDPRTFNLCPDALETKFKAAAERNLLPKVLIAVHMCGQPCVMDKIGALCKKYDVRLIEDASHAIGSKYQNIATGSCTYSDIVIFSFHPVKIITTGEGGMAVTNDNALAQKMRLLRTHGITRDPAEMHKAAPAEWYYEQIDLGFNYRMTDIQAALGISQMKSLDAPFLKNRHVIADNYARMLDDLPMQLPWVHPDTYSSYHLYVVRLRLDLIGLTRDEVFRGLRSRGILVNLHYIPVYRHPYYEKLGFKPGYCPEAEKYYAEAISLPMYSNLGTEDQQRVVNALKEVLSS